MFSLSPQICLQLVAALEAIGPLVAQSRKSEDLQKLLRLVQLAGEVSLKKKLFTNDTNTVYFNCVIVLFFYPLGQSFDVVLIDFLCPLTYGLRRSVQFSCDLKKLISPHLPLKSNSLSFSKTSPSVTSPPSHDLKAFDQFAVGHQLWQFGETIARQTISSTSIVPGNAVGHPVKFAQFQQLLHFGRITEQENRTHCVFLEFSFSFVYFTNKLQQSEV